MINRKERIELTDSMMSAMMKLAEGNPGAVSALCKQAESASAIDPDSAFGPLGALLSLDGMGIYGPNIWMLWKDVCNQNAVSFHALLRAVQLGLVPEREVIDAATSGRTTLDLDDVLKRVQKELPAFAAAA
jgi:hypothetical protein